MTRAILLLALGWMATTPARAQECAERKPISVFIALDASVSMAGAGQAAAADFAAQLVNALAGTGAFGEGNVYVFAVTQLNTGFVGSTATLSSFINQYAATNLNANSGTNLFGAIIDAAALTHARSNANFKLAVVLTDGEDSVGAFTQSQAEAQIASAPEVFFELIHAGAGSPGTLASIAASGPSHIQARSADLGALPGLVQSIVDRTCINFRPHAAFTMSPSDGLDLGIDGFLLTFDGSPSWDTETSDDALQYQWHFVKGAEALDFSGKVLPRTFTDASIGTWTVTLTVTDARGATDSESATFEIRGSPPNITLHAPTVVDALQQLQLEVTPADDIDGGGPFGLTWSIVSSPATAAQQPPAPVPPWTSAAVSWTTDEGDISIHTDGTRIGTWRVRVRAEDNEHDSDEAVVEFDVRNLVPELVIDGLEQVRVGEAIDLSSASVSDPDGGAIAETRWHVIQVPASAGLTPMSPPAPSFATGAVFDRLTSASDAGTWIFRHTVVDNEGEAVDEDKTVLVDADPIITIVADPVDAIQQPLVIDASDTEDPDSPNCPGDPNHCHLNSEGPAQVSGGITRWTWTLVDLPSNAPDGVAPGYVSDVLGVSGNGPTLNVPAFRLSEGGWTFQLEVEDAEGNVVAKTQRVDMVIQDGPPLAIAWGPIYRLGDAAGNIAEPVAMSGSWSFDPDNLFPGRTLPGITAYEWQFLPLGSCPAHPLVSGPMTIVWPTGLVPLPCFGLHGVQLTVTDDDTTPKTDTAVWPFVLSNCDGMVCLDFPTHDHPTVVDFAERTEVLIGYHLNAAIYQLPTCLFGCYADIVIAHDSAPSVPLFTFHDPNPIGTTLGGQHVFSWNGFVADPVTHQLRRPVAGHYNVTVEVKDVFFVGIGHSDSEPQSILIQVAETSFAPDSDTELALDKAETGADVATVHFTLTGGVTATELRKRVYVAGQPDPIFDHVEPIGIGTVTWDGAQDIGGRVDPGYYELTLTPIGPSGELGESARHPIVAYRVNISLDGVAEADEDVPGAFLLVGATVHQGHISIAPDGLLGEIALTADPADDTLEAVVPVGSLIAGIAITPAAAFPQTGLQFRVKHTTAAPVKLRVGFRSATLNPAKESVDEVTIDPVEVDARAPCSDDDREASDGIFVQRRHGVAPFDFASEAPMMRRIRLTSSHEFDHVRVSVREGLAPSTKATVFGLASALAPLPTQLGNDFQIHPTLFGGAAELDTDLFVRGLDFGDAELVVELVKDGAVLVTDTILLRVGDLPPLAGIDVAGYPHFRTARAFGAGQPMRVALDPAFHDERRGLPAKVYVVNHRDAAAWAADKTLVDVTGGPEDFTVPPGPIDITGSQVVAWPAVALAAPAESQALDVVIDYGGCPDTPQVPTYGTLDPEDIILPIEDPPSLVALGDLVTLGPLATKTIEYGDDVEEPPPAGLVCTPREDTARYACTNPGAVCPQDHVCVDDDGGGAHCTRVRPPEPAAGPPCPATACPNGQTCWDANHDGVGHCLALAIPEDLGGAVCPPALCPLGQGCYDTNGDAVAHCTAAAPLCPPTEDCVATDGDEVPHCRPRAKRIQVPRGFDTFFTAGEPNCADTIDDDGNGATDCADPGCFFDAACRTENCTNGVNDDANPLIDCDQPQCLLACWPGMRLRGRIVRPDPMVPGAPIVVMAHGRHFPRNITFPALTLRWRHAVGLPIAQADQTGDQNYRGHDWLQRHLASHGFVTVSVDLDEAFGAPDFGYPVAGFANRLRGWLVLKNLELVLTNPEIAGVDATKIHLFGHSRGGESVHMAWWIAGDVAARGPASVAAGPDNGLVGVTQANIASVVSLAPTTFESVAPPLAGTPFLLLYGTADGDVNGATDGVQPRRDYDLTSDSRRAFIQLRGGNHNHWNDSWIPDDAAAGANLLAKPDQQGAAKGWVLAWLRERAGVVGMSALFDEPPSRLMPVGVGAVVAYSQSGQAPGARQVLDDYETNAATTLASSGLTVAPAFASIDELALVDPHPTAAGDTADRFYGGTRGTIATWTSASSLDVAFAAPTDLRTRRTLAVRLAQQPLHPNTTALGAGLTFHVTLTDAAAQSSTVPSGIAAEIPPVYPVSLAGTATTAALFQTVRIDLDRFVVGNPGLDLAAITHVRLDFASPGASGQGAVGIDDLELE